ncbi:hypothetical protein HNQ02_003737 [Flavobacterium sp. 7E]|uniref:hypothetical protein n=1 Tax=Flavobacterium sp. 7E TaxID=2735898 RepID=UPI00157151A1|nr:hypothetical protein [Flavobacterium sp. 7E]NRS90790.1 hypothetical protein [Flavobacterium sp. 7E]
MKKILFLLIFITSCNQDMNVQPTACINLIRYYEPSKHNILEPSVLIRIKVKDSSVYKKLERGELKRLIMYSIKKEDQDRFLYNTSKPLIKEGNNFSFIIYTSYFMSNVKYRKNHEEREWEPEKIIKALDGNIGLVFEKDTILATSCGNKKMIIQTINE